MPGPSKTPSAILERRGSWRAKIRPLEPQPELGIPPCPTFLKGPAKRVWNELTRDLLAMGILTELDGTALARYCALWTRWETLAVFAERSPRRRDNSIDDQKMLDECERAMMRLSDHLLKLERQFGMTPASRLAVFKSHDVT